MSGEWSLNFLPEGRVCVLVQRIVFMKCNVWCEIEAYVETHLCELRRILRSRVLRVLCDVMKDVIPQLQNLTGVELFGVWVYKYVAVDVCMT